MAGGGNTTFGGMWNSLVHVLMYSYYFLAAAGPAAQRYLWWKKYLTSMQMVQFLVVFVHCLVPLIHPSCGYSVGVNLVIMFNGCLYWFLFLAFYRDKYTKSNKLDVNGNKKEK